MKSVRFEWDEAKRQANLGKHGLDFTDAETVFADDTASFEDDRENYGEQRFLSFGLLQGRVVVIAHTEREGVIRVISMRKASKHEERSYFSQSETDFERLDAMKDDDIDFSDIPEVPPEMFARSLVRKGLKPARRKVQLTLRLDANVLSWFKDQGRGYQTRINSILKAYKEAHETSG